MTTATSLRGAKSTQRATTATLTARGSSLSLPRLVSAPRRRPYLSSSVVAAASGSGATGAWLDLASFITGTSGKKGPYDELADAIGEIFFAFFFLSGFFLPSFSFRVFFCSRSSRRSSQTCFFLASNSAITTTTQTGKAAYVDVQGWHVYLSDLKVSGAPLSGILAGELGPLASQGGKAALSPAAVDEFLAKVPLKLGGGKATVSLLDSIPSFALEDLHRAVEDWARNGGR